MNLIVKKESIIEGLQKAAGIIPSRSGAAFLRSLWLEAKDGALTIMGTDANIEFTGMYPADVREEGLIGVNGRNFVDLIRRLPNGEVKIRLEGQSIILEQGRRTYKLPANDPTWFQKFSGFQTEGAVTWSGDFFQEIIDRVFFCVSDDEASDAIACLYLTSVGDGHIEVCGLNGHQFALTRFTHDELAALLPEKGILIQRKYVSELRKWLGGDEIELNITPKRLFIRSGNGQETLSLPRASYEYPDYSPFMQRLAAPGASLLTLNRKDCLDALDRISIFNTETERCTYFDLSSGDAMLSAQGQDTGSANESLEVTYAGDIARIAFPTKNLMEIMTHYQSPELSLTLTGAEGPCGITGKDDPEYTVLIMPMKISEESYYEEQ